jgi:outer membrane protein OmpA-like peptidoglycan-associated protein
MGKKYYITESQMKQIVSHVKNDDGQDVIEEGFKEWVITGLMTLASLGGVQAQDIGTITDKHIEAAEKVQDLIKSGDKDVLKYFSDSKIKLNDRNLETLKGTKIKKNTEIGSTTADSKGTLQSKLNQGYAVSKVIITSDTIYPKGIQIQAQVQDTVPFGYKADNMFKTASFELKSEIKQDLQSAINEINEAGGEIVGVQIESSTDTEPIKMGNEKLAQLRAESVENVLGQLGVDASMDINILPDQGPDVYSKGMSSQERTQTRKETQEYRYVNITFIVVIPVDFETSGETPPEPILKKTISYELVKLKNVSKKHGNYKFKGRSKKPTKLKSCRAKLKGKSLPCATF